jgi:hypothetical protein
MRTTLDLPDALMREVKVLAARQDRKLKEVVERLIRAGLRSEGSETPPSGGSVLAAPAASSIRKPKRSAQRPKPQAPSSAAPPIGSPESEAVIDSSFPL